MAPSKLNLFSIPEYQNKALRESHHIACIIIMSRTRSESRTDIKFIGVWFGSNGCSPILSQNFVMSLGRLSPYFVAITTGERF